MPTNAIYGFTTMLRKLLVEERPEYLAVVFDPPGPVFRHGRFADYKANRPPAPADLNVQAPYARQVCEALGVRVLELEGYEADDVIATYATRARDSRMQVVIVASDKDLLQLVRPGVGVLNPTKNERLDADAVARSFGTVPERVRDVLGLMGDSIDNIPGVPGVGEKTALALVSTYGDLERVIEHAGRIVDLFAARDAVLEALAGPSGAAPDLLERLGRALDAYVEREVEPELAARARALLERIALPEAATPAGARVLKRELQGLDKGSGRRTWTAVAQHAEQARLSRELATLQDQVPLSFRPEELRVREPDQQRARELFGTLGFRSLMAEFAEDDGAAAERRAPAERGSYRTVLDAAALERLVADCRAAGRFAIDTETDQTDPRRARLVGIALAYAAGAGWYLPLGHDYLGAPEQLPLAAVRERLGPLLADPAVGKVAQNLKFDTHVLERYGFEVAGWQLDTMVAAFLLDASRTSYALDALVEDYLGYRTMPYSALAGSGSKQITLNLVDAEQVAQYAGEDADMTLRLAQRLEPRLAATGLIELYRTIDGPLLPVLIRMERWGIRVDVERLAGMGREMEQTLNRARAEIHALAGGEFNVDSPKQLREVLFERLALKPGRKTAKSRVASTDAQTLEELADEHEIARKLLEYRELAKLKGTYVDALPRLVHPESGRVHTSFHPTGAATGRLSSSDPNLQNIPARTEAGRRIRSAFVPERGWVFLASDYSQIELRVLAHLADDPGLAAAFRAGEDIHRYTASRVAGIAPELVDAEMRQRAKAVNFGILYGMSETRLAREQGMSRVEARRFVQAYFERFSKVRAYIERVRDEARQEAKVRTLFGRERPFPQLRQRTAREIQEQALRAAVNTTVQGTAADLMKLAMLRVDERLAAAGLRARMLLQVHDELLLEVPEGEIEQAEELVREAMEGVHPLSVPLVADQKVGASWLEVT